MHNYLKVWILSILVLLILLTIYMMMDSSSSQKTLKAESIQIKPIQITPIEVIKEISIEKKSVPILAVDILSKLKNATKQSKEAIVLSKKAQSKQVITSQKKKIKKVVKQKVVIKKKPRKKPRKKIVVHKKKTIIKKEPLQQKKILAQKVRKKLSREKEVFLYNEQYSNTLEVVNVSDNFEIKEENTLPDSYYFETPKKVKTPTKNAPLKFVKKLGVVTVSNKYEKEFMIPKKEELAKEGIVNINNASLETREMKDLSFVDKLGIVEVSQDFETIDADRHLN